MFINKDEINIKRKDTITAHEVKLVKNSCANNFTPFVLLIGLGTHAVFEGLALGLQEKVDKAFIFAVAIALHKGAAGMSLGISMAKTFPEDKTFVAVMMTMFACFSPFGVILGLLLGDTNEMVEVVFSCLAGGTFMYIAMSEVIVEEFSIPKYKYTKLLFFILGIGVITSLHFLE